MPAARALRGLRAPHSLRDRFDPYRESVIRQNGRMLDPAFLAAAHLATVTDAFVLPMEAVEELTDEPPDRRAS